MGNRNQELENHECVVPCGYEPPRVERVLTPAELEREVLYAGDTTADGSSGT
jgi:hypothetical protein